jgi:hypothetical protein
VKQLGKPQRSAIKRTALRLAARTRRPVGSHPARPRAHSGFALICFHDCEKAMNELSPVTFGSPASNGAQKGVEPWRASDTSFAIHTPPWELVVRGGLLVSAARL